MSAIRCKTLICLLKASGTANTMVEVIDDLEKNPELMDEVIKCQEKYISVMEPIFKGLTENA